MGLYIDIQKQLPGFRLQVKISCEPCIIGILGASGSGKSMLLHSVAGLITPDHGKIVLNDQSFFDSEKRIDLATRERRVGFLFQNFALFPHLTIAENIGFGLDGLPKSKRKQKTDALMAMFNIGDMAGRYPSQISGGQQQRVALARALAVEPDILLLDEPFSALDNHLKNNLMQEMRLSLQKFSGTTLFVTHNVEEAYRLCDRIAVLDNGQVEAFDRREEIFQRPLSLATAKITGCKNITEAVRKTEHTLQVPDWGVEINTGGKIGKEKGFVGIRANHIMLADEFQCANCFPVWIAEESAGPFRSSLYLKIGSPPHRPGDYHLQWEISRDQQAMIRTLRQPINIYLDPLRVFFVPN